MNILCRYIVSFLRSLFLVLSLFYICIRLVYTGSKSFVTQIITKDNVLVFFFTRFLSQRIIFWHTPSCGTLAFDYNIIHKTQLKVAL